jgi:phosphate transport system substrate-binding protein
LKRITLLALVIAFASAGMTTALATPASAANAGSLTGAGSTLVAQLMASWTSGVQAANGIQVTYGAVGSGAGIAQITARTVDFGASDAPLTSAQAAACNRCVQMPWGMSALGMGFHLGSLRRLTLSGPVLAAIYLGKITSWNDPAIAKLNKGVKLPNERITPVFRSDGSGSTFAFTDYLDRVSSIWRSRVGSSTAVNFPTGVGAKGSAGVTAVVASTEGAIGYIETSYLITHGVPGAAIVNAAGRAVYPNLANIEAAGKSVTRVPANNELHIVNPSRKYKFAYPISTFTYVIVPIGSPKKSLLSTFINYVITKGQSFGPALDFPPIPKVVQKAVRNSLSHL